jgi:hypothetical protein
MGVPSIPQGPSRKADPSAHVNAASAAKVSSEVKKESPTPGTRSEMGQGLTDTFTQAKGLNPFSRQAFLKNPHIDISKLNLSPPSDDTVGVKSSTSSVDQPSQRTQSMQPSLLSESIDYFKRYVYGFASGAFNNVRNKVTEAVEGIRIGASDPGLAADLLKEDVGRKATDLAEGVKIIAQDPKLAGDLLADAGKKVKDDLEKKLEQDPKGFIQALGETAGAIFSEVALSKAGEYLKEEVGISSRKKPSPGSSPPPGAKPSGAGSGSSVSGTSSAGSSSVLLPGGKSHIDQVLEWEKHGKLRGDLARLKADLASADKPTRMAAEAEVLELKGEIDAGKVPTYRGNLPGPDQPHYEVKARTEPFTDRKNAQNHFNSKLKEASDQFLREGTRGEVRINLGSSLTIDGQPITKSMVQELVRDALSKGGRGKNITSVIVKDGFGDVIYQGLGE